MSNRNSNATPTRYIYKITPSSPKLPVTSFPVGKLPTDFNLPSSDLDQNSGFVHMSTAKQIPGTLEHFFASKSSSSDSIYLLRVGYSSLLERKDAQIRWESPDASICGPREGEGMFPHIYAIRYSMDSNDSSTANTSTKALFLLSGESVDSVAIITSEAGEDGWHSALRRLGDWLQA